MPTGIAAPQPLLRCHRRRLPLHCQEGEADGHGQVQAVRPQRDHLPRRLLPQCQLVLLPLNLYCAATAADWPFVAKKEKLMGMAKSKQCGPNETTCPAGCCPNANWYCCPDNLYCAATAADCPFVAAREYMQKLASRKHH